jgi:hypothetical protein
MPRAPPAPDELLVHASNVESLARHFRDAFGRPPTLQELRSVPLCQVDRPFAGQLCRLPEQKAEG